MDAQQAPATDQLAGLIRVDTDERVTALPGHRRDRLHRRPARPRTARRRAPGALPGPLDPARLRDQPWADEVEVVRGRRHGRRARCGAAMRGVDVAYYLVHALGAGRGLRGDRPATAARTFAEAARAAGVRPDRLPRRAAPRRGPEEALSPHLRSRAEVGRILLDSGVPTAVLRAAVIIGSGSASFEMLRYLTERLPVDGHAAAGCAPASSRSPYATCCATWSAARGCRADVNRAFDIGGPDVLTYRDMMRGYAAVAGLPRRLIVPVPVLTPRLSSHWVGLVTPVPAAIARPLVESLRHEVVCREHDIARYVPDPPGGLLGFDEALRLALRRIRDARGGDPLVVAPSVPGRAERPAADRPGLGGRQPLHRPRGRATVDALAGAAVAGDRGHRRRQRLVLLPARLGRPRLAGPAGRRGGAAPRPAGPAAAAGRRLAGLLAGRGDRAGPAAAAAGRDAAAGAGLAGDAR